MKKLIFWLILLVLICGFMEATAWVGYRILFGENFSFSKISEIRETATSLSKDSKQEKSTVYMRHPYYGYVMNPIGIGEAENKANVFAIEDHVNAYGFFGDTSPIQPRNPKKLVVAVIGGSVAAYTVAWGRKTFLEGLSKLPEFKGREIVLLNFALPSYKQPQQVMVIGDILSQGGHIDLLINIDGFNEIALPNGEGAFFYGISPFFPQNWKNLSETNLSHEAMLQLGRIALLQESRAKWADYAGCWPWRYSVTVSTIWRIIDNTLKMQQPKLEQSLGKGAGARMNGAVPSTEDLRTSLGPPDGFNNARELYEASSSHWARSSVMLNNMVASQGGVYVHLLQPNQYFPGSRPAGADNVKTVINMDSLFKPEVEHGYPYLRSAGHTLQQSGIRFYDMTLLFKDDHSPVYGDNCCHFTREGNVKLVQAIIANVANSLSKNPRPHLASFVDADYRLETLRTLTLQPSHYKDGSEVKLIHSPR